MRSLASGPCQHGCPLLHQLVADLESPGRSKFRLGFYFVRGKQCDGTVVVLGKFKKEKQTNIYLKSKKGGVRESDETGTKRVKKKKIPNHWLLSSFWNETAALISFPAALRMVWSHKLVPLCAVFPDARWSPARRRVLGRAAAPRGS